MEQQTETKHFKKQLNQFEVNKVNVAEKNKCVQSDPCDASKAIQTLKIEKVRLNDDIQQLKDMLNTKENDKQQLTKQLAESEYNGKSTAPILNSQLEQVLISKKNYLENLEKINADMSQKFSFLKTKLKN